MKLRRPAHGAAVREGMRAINIRHTKKSTHSVPINARPESCILWSESYRAAMTLPVNCGNSHALSDMISGGKLARDGCAGSAGLRECDPFSCAAAGASYNNDHLHACLLICDGGNAR